MIVHFTPPLQPNRSTVRPRGARSIEQARAPGARDQVISFTAWSRGTPKDTDLELHLSGGVARIMKVEPLGQHPLVNTPEIPRGGLIEVRPTGTGVGNVRNVPVAA